MSQSMNPGNVCTWLHVPRGGYGYTVRVPAVIVRVTVTGRVRIRATRIDGSEVERVVRHESLRLRCAMCRGERRAIVRRPGCSMPVEIKCDRCDTFGEVAPTPRRNGGG